MKNFSITSIVSLSFRPSSFLFIKMCNTERVHSVLYMSCLYSSICTSVRSCELNVNLPTSLKIEGITISGFASCNNTEFKDEKYVLKFEGSTASSKKISSLCRGFTILPAKSSLSKALRSVIVSQKLFKGHICCKPCSKVTQGSKSGAIRSLAASCCLLRMSYLFFNTYFANAKTDL